MVIMNLLFVWVIRVYIKEWFRNYMWQVSDVNLQLDKPNSVNFLQAIFAGLEGYLVETGLDNMTGSRLSLVQQYLAMMSIF